MSFSFFEGNFQLRYFASYENSNFAFFCKNTISSPINMCTCEKMCTVISMAVNDIVHCLYTAPPYLVSKHLAVIQLQYCIYIVYLARIRCVCVRGSSTPLPHSPLSPPLHLPLPSLLLVNGTRKWSSIRCHHGLPSLHPLYQWLRFSWLLSYHEIPPHPLHWLCFGWYLTMVLTRLVTPPPPLFPHLDGG